MVPEYVDTKVKVATKSINSLKQVRNQVPTKDQRIETAGSHYHMWCLCKSHVCWEY